MTNEQEPKIDDKEIVELAEILLALQSRLPTKTESSETKSNLSNIEAKPVPEQIPVVVAAPAVEPQPQQQTQPQVTVDSPPSSPEGHSKKENHAPSTPVTNKRPAPVTSTEQSNKKDLVEQERKKRKRVTEDQLTVLETIFATDKMPDQKLRLQLAQRLGMSSRRVQIWFQNKRAKLKKANSNSPSSSPLQGKLTAAGSQALYSARFSLPSNNTSSNNNNVKSLTATTTTPPNAPSNNSNNGTSGNNNTSLMTSFNFPISFHPFASPNFLGSYSNTSSMPGGSNFSLPISRPVK